MIRTRRTDKRSGASGCFVPIAASAAVADAPFLLPGRGFAPAHHYGSLGMALVDAVAGRTFPEGGGGKTATALCAGNAGPVAPPLAAGIGSGSHPALSGAITAGQQPPRSRVANRGTSAAGLCRRGLSAGRFSASFSASVYGLRPRPENFFAELPPPRFPRRRFRAGDNTTMRCHSTPGRW